LLARNDRGGDGTGQLNLIRYAADEPFLSQKGFRAVIDRLHYLGLSQLYQIRGRVGRSSRRAYAYLTYRGGKILTETATRRLSAVREFTEFGAGYRVALRDLEIRGAGTVLGAEQHGHMEAVGYDLYLKLLEEAVREERGEDPIPWWRTLKTNGELNEQVLELEARVEQLESAMTEAGLEVPKAEEKPADGGAPVQF